MSLDAIADQMRARVADSGFDKSVKFDLGSAGVIVIDGKDVSTADAAADCVITMSKDDFDALVAGELNPTAAFMQGKLRIDGDMSVAMSLSSLL
jgi:putative sterol carrier protein